MLRCRKNQNDNIFRAKRPVFEGEKAETATAAPQSRAELLEKYENKNEREALYNKAEAKADEALAVPAEQSAEAVAKLANKIKERVATVRDFEKQNDLLINSEATGLHQLYERLVKLQTTGRSGDVRLADSEARRLMAELGMVPGRTEAVARTTTPQTEVDPDLAALTAMAAATEKHLASRPVTAPTESAGGPVMPTQSVSTGPAALNLGRGSGGPIGPIAAERTPPTPATTATAPGIEASVGRVTQVEGPKAAQSEAEKTGPREIGVGRLPNEVRSAYELYTKNPTAPAKFETTDAVYTFKRVATTSGAVTINRVAVFKENKA